MPVWACSMGLRSAKTGETLLCFGQRNPAAHEGNGDVSQSQEKQDQRKGERKTRVFLQ